MHKLSYKIWGLTVAATFGLSLVASAQNLLTNGDFESSTPGAPSGAFGTLTFWNFDSTTVTSKIGGGWSYSNGAKPTALEINTAAPNNTYFVGFGTDGAGASGTLSQNFTATQSVAYTTSLDVAFDGEGEPVSLRFSILDRDNGNTVVGFQDVTSSQVSNYTTSAFTTFSFVFTAPSNNLAFQVTDTTSAGVGSSTDIVFDKASVSVIPEPSTFAAMVGGLALGATLVRRRRPDRA